MKLDTYSVATYFDTCTFLRVKHLVENIVINLPFKTKWEACLL